MPIVVVGGGGMGRCALDVIDAMNAADAGGQALVEVVGVVDDGDPDRELLGERGVAFLGPVAAIQELPNEVGYVIGIGSPQVRRRIDQELLPTGRVSPALVHPNVHQGFGVVIGPGSIICSHVSLENNLRLGRHVHLNQNSTVGHDTLVDDYCTISPLSAISGAVQLRPAAFIGSGASVRQGVTVHEEAVVGLGAAVVRDVPPRMTVVGVPARPTAPRGDGDGDGDVRS